MPHGSVSDLYPDLVDGTYDCVDWIVLRGYCRFIQAPAGFRIWWRRWQGCDENLDNAHLIRLAGRFGRRVRAWAEKAHVPVIFSSAGERKDEIADAHLPTDPTFRGVFLVVVGRAPASVLKVQRTAESARMGGAEGGALRARLSQGGQLLYRLVQRRRPGVSLLPQGFTVSDFAPRVRAALGETPYTISQAAYDLRKLRGKGLLSELPRSRRYRAEPQSLRALAALLILRDHVIRPLLAGVLVREITHEPQHHVLRDQQYGGLRNSLNDLFREVGIAA